jgi:hypothetical protein
MDNGVGGPLLRLLSISCHRGEYTLVACQRLLQVVSRPFAVGPLPATFPIELGVR